MQTIVINSQKGGSGKTSLCAHLAVEAERAGDGPVYLIDTDPQGTAASAISRGSVAKFERTTADSICCTEPRPHILWLPEILQQPLERLGRHLAVRIE
jgi:cellulose biosynthesis protein BcsQ